MISVIIPIFNTARWLPQCLDSLLEQDYRDIEVILVNDASTDGSLAICQEYSDRDDRIVIIDKPRNEGLELARRSGLAIARGKYVMHIDSDDWLDHSEVLSKMYRKAEETGADYVEIGVQKVLDRRKWIKKPCCGSVSGEIAQPLLFDKYFISYFGYNYLTGTMCGKLYRRSVLEKADIKPLGIFMQEDVAYNMNLFPYLEKIYIMNEVGYNYRWGGNTSRYYPFIEEYKKLYRRKKELIEQYAYHKALFYTRIELKNVLKTEICNRIAFKQASGRQAIIAGIASEIEDPVYADLSAIEKTSDVWQEPFFRALISKDAAQLYDLCRERVKKERPERWLKQIGFRLLNLI